MGQMGLWIRLLRVRQQLQREQGGLTAQQACLLSDVCDAMCLSPRMRDTVLGDAGEMVDGSLPLRSVRMFSGVTITGGGE